MKKTLFDKVWDSHVVRSLKNGPDVLFIDRHMVHEVTSPVAFLGLKKRNIKVLFPERTFATADHNTPTIDKQLPVKDKLSNNPNSFCLPASFEAPANPIPIEQI